MRTPNFDHRDRTTILIHYYRAMVGRADTWRTRMDITANWAIGATFAITTLTLGNTEAPHFVMLIASLMTLSFLILEARRLTFYRLWQERVLLLENGLIRPALASSTSEASEASSSFSHDLEDALDIHLGRTIPNMPLHTAIARRLRRMYLYLFAVQLLAWIFKLATHPTATQSLELGIERARISLLPGAWVVGLAALLYATTLVYAFLYGGIDSTK